MENNNSVFFNRLLALKKEGYTYLTSCQDVEYGGYDQAVADSYDDGCNEPSYGDWIREKGLDSSKYVTFHSNLLIYGEFANRCDYKIEIIDLDYDLEKMKKLYRIFFGEPYYEKGWKKEKCLQGDFDARYVDLIAYAIWNLNFENENQRIDSIEKFIEFHVEEDNNVFGSNHPGFFNSENGEWGYISDFITAFVKVELYNDVTFLEKLLNLKNGPEQKLVKCFLSQSFKITNNAFYIQHFPEDLSI